MTEWTFQSSWQGRLPYAEALELQQDLAAKIRAGSLPDQILGLEHPYVITLGKRSRLDPEVPQGPIQWIDRGGEATIHSEGQLVIYPLVKLRPRFELRAWVEFLHVVTEKALQKVGVPVERGDNSGLWTSTGKIAFMGLRIKEGVSLHGLSLNVRNDLSLFSPLKACGVRGALMDSLANQGKDLETGEFFQIWMQEFRGLSCSIPKF